MSELSTSYLATYEEPGGLWFGVTFNLVRNCYEVHNEAGQVVFSDGWEAECRRWARDALEGYSC